ncbi:MAG: hypothetical protein NW202_13460 [Nitrospira sp.]|nr:hypothetical protein [Nitrospira sp.]
MSTVLTGTIAHALKETLDEIIDDDTDGVESKAVFTKWCKIKSMEDNYEDDLETGGPGLASEKAESASLATGTIRQGYLTRYLARTFGLKLIISQEALEDRKYPKVINAARRLKRAMWKTADIDATNMLVRMFNSAYVGGDGLCLGNASHTLPNLGTFSNIMGTPLSPSRTAVIQARTAVGRMPGHDGVTEGYELETVVCPLDQWAVWDGLINSTKAPEAGQFNEINVVNRLGLKVVPIKYWSNTTTNWAVITDAENGPQFRWRVRPESSSWYENNNTVMMYGTRARWSRGWSDPRGIFCVNA